MKVDLYSVEAPEGGRVSIMGRPRGGDWLDGEMVAARRQGVDVLVSALTSPEASELGLTEEASAATASGIAFVTLPIPDRGLPSNGPNTADLIAELRAAVHEGKHVAIHCRMGIGRSSLIAAALLASRSDEVDRVFDSLSEARGLAVPDTEEQKAWVRRFVGALATSE